MSCLFVLSNMREYGGAEHSISALLPYFAEHRRVLVFAENDRHIAALEKLSPANLEVVRLPKGNAPGAWIEALGILRRRCVAERPGAILANGHKGSLMLFLLQALLPAPRPRFAVYVRDFDYHTFRYTLWGMRSFRFFAPTGAVFEHPAYQKWGLTKLSHEVISNGVPIPAEEQSAPPPVDGYIGCCARITPWKGIEYAIRAMGRLVAARPEARLHIHGDVLDQEYFDSLTRLVTELGLEKNVIFLPFAADIGRVYREGRCFVIPSLSILPGPESFGRIIIEAWSHRRPVVAFRAGGPAHLIDDGENGFLVEERNVEELADRLERLLADHAFCTAMGESGYRKVLREFDPRRIAQTLLARLFPAAIAP